MKTKSIIWITIIIALIITTAYYFYNLGQKNQIIIPEINTPTTTIATSTINEGSAAITGYRKFNNNIISFEHPSELTVTDNNNVINLNHSIDYKHENFCDLKGDGGYLNKFTDLNLNIELVNQNVKSYLQKSEWPGFEYASKNPYKTGDLNGYKIEEGIEGCGQTIYYFDINKTKTLIVKHSYVPELNPINNKVSEFLAIPGMIPQDKSNNIISNIFSTIVVK